MSDDASREDPQLPSEAYSRYVLGVLVVVYVLNFLDRQIITILAEDIKAGPGDHATRRSASCTGRPSRSSTPIFGIPLGRLADVWSRRTLISLGLAFWSLATAVSGLARNFVELAARRGWGSAWASRAPRRPRSRCSPTPSRFAGAGHRARPLLQWDLHRSRTGPVDRWTDRRTLERWRTRAAMRPSVWPGWQAAYLAVGLPGLLARHLGGAHCASRRVARSTASRDSARSRTPSASSFFELRSGGASASRWLHLVAGGRRAHQRTCDRDESGGSRAVDRARRFAQDSSLRSLATIGPVGRTGDRPLRRRLSWMQALRPAGSAQTSALIFGSAVAAATVCDRLLLRGLHRLRDRRLDAHLLHARSTSSLEAPTSGPSWGSRAAIAGFVGRGTLGGLARRHAAASMNSQRWDAC